MNLPPGIEKLWTGLVPIAFPVWISGLVILLWPARVYDFLELQPIRDKWGPLVGVLTLFFFTLWFYERVWPGWHSRLYRLRPPGRSGRNFRADE
jgi:hypothetical protein